ncbi:MAG: peptide MFS transporter [Chthoniobacteraceae bacterium]
MPVPAPVEIRQPHPRGMVTLFFTEMWERFSYYGMRALLVLFMVDAVQDGGLGLDDKTATAIYGLYTAAVYLAALPGGWMGDRLLGARGGVWWGGIVIFTGHVVLAFHGTGTFYAGLILVALGSGLLKSNMSGLVGELYPEGGARRDAGFTLFYMGVNLGAFIGPLVCSGLGEKFGWRWGFSAAAVGMLLGLVQFRLSRRHLGGAGLLDTQPGDRRTREWLALGVALLLLTVLTGLCLNGIISVDPIWLAANSAVVILALALGYFILAFTAFGLTTAEKKRVAVIAVLFVASAIFWAGFEQVGSSLSLFAERFTVRDFGGWEMPAGWFQSVNPLFIILLAPLVAGMWVRLARRGIEPRLATKFAWGLLLLALGFVIAAAAAERALPNHRVWPSWLISVYLVHTIGELFLSPVGLSAVTKLSPPRLVGQMMGVWFLATSLGNLLAGLLAGEVSGVDTATMPMRFLQVVATAGGAGLLLWLCAKPIQKLMPGIR